MPDVFSAVFGNPVLLLSVLAAAVQTGTPLVYATLGEIITTSVEHRIISIG